jgi:hypothetical protein
MPACDLRRLPAFRLCPSNLNLPTLVGVAFSASLSRRPPTRAGGQPFEFCLRSSTSGLHRLPRLSSLALLPTSDLRRRPTLRLCLPTSTSGLHRLPRSPAFTLLWASDLRRLPTLQLCLGTSTSDFHLRIDSPALLPDRPSDFRRRSGPSGAAIIEPTSDSPPTVAPSGLALRLTLGLRRLPTLPPCLPTSAADLLRRHQLRRTLGLASLCMQLQIGRFLCKTRSKLIS